MKKFLQFSGFIALVLGLVAFILLMASHSVVYADNTANWYSGISAVFGGGTAQVSIAGWSNSGSVNAKLAWPALIGWILILVAMIILLAGVVLPLLKVKALEKFAGVLNLVAVAALVTAGILIFFTEPAFGAANEWSEESIKAWTLGGGYIAAGILSIVGGAIAILPAAIDFVGKKK
ncbi:MAG: hypothetical protein J5511_05905 [Bacilli bacterium]|nr:hypothetical protein [Bacilli bacterium]